MEVCRKMQGDRIISALIGLVGAMSNNGKTERTDSVVREAFYAADVKIIAAKRDLIEAICKKMSSSELIPETVYQGIAYLGYDLEPEAYTQIQQKIMCYDLIQ